MSAFRSSFLAIMTLLGLSPPNLSAAAAPVPAWYEQPGLSGDWGGKRTQLEEAGLSFGAVYKGDFFKSQQATEGSDHHYAANYDLTLAIDGGKLWGWNHSKALIYALGNEGSDPNEMVGSIQGMSNIAAPTTWKLYQAWLDLPLVNQSNALMLLVGLYDVNSEFDSKRFGSVFLNPTHGIGTDFSQSGENGPSIFPTTSLGGRLHFQISDEISLLTAVLDAVPGDPQNPKATHFKHPPSDGLLSLMEWRWIKGEEQPDQYQKVALGAWTYSKDAQQIDSSDRSKGNSGFYLIAETVIFAEAAHPDQGLGAYLRWGQAQERFNPIGQAWAGALSYTGLIPGRDADVLGLGLGSTQAGKPYARIVESAGGEHAAESIIEATYKVQLLPALSAQFDVQHVTNPGTDSEQKERTLIGCRLEAKL